MRSRKGYTMVEMAVVILLMSIITAAAFGFIKTSFKQYEVISKEVDSPIQKIRVINTVEEVVTGCQSVTVTPSQITVISSKGTQVINIDDFPKLGNLVFAKQDDTVIVSIGGAEFCVPISYEQ